MKRDFFQINIIIVSVIISILAFIILPKHVPTHWTSGGFDKPINKIWIVSVMPLVMLVTQLLFLPFKRKVGSVGNNNISVINRVHNMLLCFLLAIHLILIAVGLDFRVSIKFFAGIFIGLVIIVLCIPLKKTEPNKVYGLRTKWTLKDERVWVEANHFAANLFLAIGLLIVGLSFVITEYITLVSIILVIIGAGIATYVSYKLYKQLNV
ncbi:SdpI family protein [Paenibacillus sp. sgz5001063]|uniref:SdpI family protein n=1 Tax=Paenibacillus sp. sgz5001063 TaxID=3242474 RepID=UPI0036D210A6